MALARIGSGAPLIRDWESMPQCTICLQQRPSLKFKTGRLSICRYCVSSLNNTGFSAREAEQHWLKAFRDAIVRRQPEAERWVDRWLGNSGAWILAQRLTDPQQVGASHHLKILRAYRSGIICLDRRYLDYPKNWDFKRYRMKQWHGNACSQCGASEADGTSLHAHHIIFRSNSGTNSYRNLVTLCLKHHQAQHDHPISNLGGEPRGNDADELVEEIDVLCAETESPILPSGYSESAYFAARPTFESAFEAFLANGKTARQFFVFLIQTFGNNVREYALKFAADVSSGRTEQ